ncbi:MAG: helix-turn-helix transcriptional regulator [Clostridia bacterium]|nr:helix-turn-helix transcriptional regulator [Clostridia bacterium]
MTLSERLRTMRKAADYTQEQLAEFLGISSQAVSRWETGATSPDISLLPQLAELFRVTVDELLGVNETEKRREIDRIVAETSAEIDRGRTQEPIRILREALNRYPNNDRLLVTLMYALYAASEDADFCREHDGEIVSIACRIREYSRDEDCRNEARRLLFRHYCDTNRRAEAMRIADTMPDIESCRQRNLYWALDGTPRAAHLRERIADELRELDWAVWAYSVHASLPEEKRAELNAMRERVKAMVQEHFPE